MIIAGNVKEFQCEDCGSQCKDQKHYDNHRYYHKNILNGPQVFCVKCKLEIPEKLFPRHVKRVHDREEVESRRIQNEPGIFLLYTSSIIRDE